MSLSRAELKRQALIELYRRDFLRFCKEQLKIRGIVPGELLPFKLDSGQRRLYDIMEAQRKEKGYIRVVTLKGRQSGWSTLSEAILFHKASLSPNYNTLLIAHDQTSTEKIFEITHLFWEEMHPLIRPMIRYSSKRELFFANPDRKKSILNPGLRSRMDFEHAGKLTAGTGSTRQALHISELAKFDSRSVDLLFSSLLPTIHPVPDTIVIMESTAFVGGDHFREMCEAARSKKSNWAWCFSPWWLTDRNRIPLKPGEIIKPTPDERRLIKLAADGQPEDDVPPHELTPEQIKWYRERRLELGDLFDQEYPPTFEEAWVNRELNVFERNILAEMREQVYDPIRYVDIQPGPRVLTVRKGGRPFSDQNYIAIWKEPERGAIYDIGVDVAAGLEDGDWSVAEVLRRDTMEQVAEAHLKIDPIDFAELCFWLGKYYNTAQIIVEMNGVGYITGNKLGLLCYPYIYIWRHRERAAPTLSSYAGFKTTWETKKLLVGNTRHAFLHRRLKIHSRVLWDEMYQYCRVGEDGYGPALGHDDAVMALMLAVQGIVDESWGKLHDGTDVKDHRPEENRATWQYLKDLGPAKKLSPTEAKIMSWFSREAL